MTTADAQSPSVCILCGGRGTRLKPTTDVMPKALVQLNGRPVLDYVIEFYSRKGLKRFILCVGYKAELIRDYYADPPEGTKIRFSDEGVEASMLHRLYALRDTFDGSLIVSYGDTFIDLDLDLLLKTHVDREAEATIVTANIRSPFGLVKQDGQGWVTSFVEKPLLNYYIGSFVLQRSALDRVTPSHLALPDGEGLVKFFEELSVDRALGMFQHEGGQITFNTETERQEAEEAMGRFYTHTEIS
ncbi:NTP transferase domain-containing protein [bacterium]|nr:NTP transferase domain-containing protein [bacterium]